MRSAQRCPKCSGQSFAVIAEFIQPNHESNSTHPFPPVTIALPGRWSQERKTLGRFEAWICIGCGYTEFYAHGLDDIKELADEYPDQLRIVEARPPEQGPYR